MSDDELTHSNGAFPKGGPVKNNKELEESRATARPDPTGPDQTRTTNDGIRSKTEQRWLNSEYPLGVSTGEAIPTRGEVGFRGNPRSKSENDGHRGNRGRGKRSDF